MPPRRRAARRTTRRRTSRRHRRRRRRRIMVGGAILVTAGAAAYGAYKFSQQDVDRIEEHTGESIDELEDDELQGAMKDLDIQSQEMTDEDKAALDAEGGTGDSQSSSQTSPQAAAAPQTAGGDDYLAELEKLGDLRDRGIITDEEFEMKKKEILGM